MTLRRKLALDYYVGGLLHMLLKPPTLLLGILLKRNHDLSRCSSLTIVKLLGGGSLVIAYPSLLAIRNSPNLKSLRLVTTTAVRPFAEILGIFDEIIVIRENSLFTMALDSILAIVKLFRCDAVVDLEVHSRLSTVFSLLTCARNRVGFYTSIAFWRKGLSTHLIFCNVSSGIYYFYDQIAQLFGGVIAEVDTFRQAFRSRMPEPTEVAPGGERRIAIAPCCSEMARERQLSADEWIAILRRRLTVPSGARPGIYLMGSPSDRAFLSELASRILQQFEGIPVYNLAGKSTLAQSVAWLRRVDLLLCIDSSLLHFGRLIGVRTISYWGPTNPATLLRPGMVPDEEVFYHRTSCSPCVHVAETPPCNGNNVCMRAAAALTHPAGDSNPTWLVSVNSAASTRAGQMKTALDVNAASLKAAGRGLIRDSDTSELQRLASAVANKEQPVRAPVEK